MLHQGVNTMNFICCHKTDAQGWVVDLGQSYAGNYDSIESFLRDQYRDFSVLGEGLCEGDYEGLWYATYEDKAPARKCDRWKLYRHEVYRPEGSGSYDAVLVLFYEPVNIVELEPQNQQVVV